MEFQTDLGCDENHPVMWSRLGGTRSVCGAQDGHNGPKMAYGDACGRWRDSFGGAPGARLFMWHPHAPSRGIHQLSRSQDDPHWLGLLHDPLWGLTNSTVSKLDIVQGIEGTQVSHKTIVGNGIKGQVYFGANILKSVHRLFFVFFS